MTNLGFETAKNCPQKVTNSTLVVRRIRTGKGEMTSKRLNPIAHGGGGLFGPHHQTVSHNSGTFSPYEILKELISQGGCCSHFFEQGVMKN